MDHKEWFEKVAGTDTVNSAAKKTDIVQRTLARQIDKGEIAAENVIKLAVAYDAHPVRALVDTGYLDEQYAEEIDPATVLQVVSEDELVQEVLRRMKLGQAGDGLTRPIDEVVESTRQSRGRDELADRRTARDAEPVFDPRRHVAMSHDQDRERYGDGDIFAPEAP